MYLYESAILALNDVSRDHENRSLDRLFPKISPAKVMVAFGRACDRAGIEDFRFHDLPHTAVSWMRMKGADIHTVALLLGLKDLRMAARYQHLSKQFLADAVRGLDTVFGDLRYQNLTEPAALIEVEAVSA